MGSFGSLPRRRGALPRKQGAGGDLPACGRPAPLGVCARSVFSRPLLPRGAPRVSPLRPPLLLVGSRSRRWRGGAAPPPAGAGGNLGQSAHHQRSGNRDGDPAMERGGHRNRVGGRQDELKQERPRRGPLCPPWGWYRALPAFAIETANAYHISGRTANTPALGIRRRGTGAHREPRPWYNLLISPFYWTFTP